MSNLLLTDSVSRLVVSARLFRGYSEQAIGLVNCQPEKQDKGATMDIREKLSWH